MKKITIIFITLFSISLQAQWVQQNSGTTQNLNDVYCINENTIVVVGDSGTILKTTDGGASWVTKTSGTVNNLKKVQFSSSNVGYVIGYSGTLLKSIDGGETWISIVTGTTTNLYGLSIVNESILFISGDNGLIKKSIDSGASFLLKSDPENNTISDIQFFGESIGYAQVGYYDANNLYNNLGNKLYKTTDGGTTWLLVLSDVIDSFFFVNENLGFIKKAQENVMFKTGNGGLSFLPLNYSNIHERDIFSLNGSIVWDLGVNPALCNCMTFCINKNEIVDFSLIQEIQACNDIYYGGAIFNVIRFANETTGYIVGWGGIIYKNDTGINLLVTEDFNKNESIIISPNPAKDQITLTFTETPNPFEVSITDFLGKTVFLQSYSAQNNVNIATAAFSKGLYFLSVINQDKKQTQKLIID